MLQNELAVSPNQDNSQITQRQSILSVLLTHSSLLRIPCRTGRRRSRRKVLWCRSWEEGAARLDKKIFGPKKFRCWFIRQWLTSKSED